MFSSLIKTNQNILVSFILSSANVFNFVESKGLSFGKDLMFRIRFKMSSASAKFDG